MIKQLDLERLASPAHGRAPGWRGCWVAKWLIVDDDDDGTGAADSGGTASAARTTLEVTVP